MSWTSHRRIHRYGAAALVAAAIAILVSPGLAYPRPGDTERVSTGVDGQEGGGSSGHSSISAEGRFVAFQSSASNLVPEDTNGRADIFLNDRKTGITELISVGGDGSGASAGSLAPSVSGDGRLVAFQSAAFNLVAEDTNGDWDVFVRDRSTGTTELMSVGTDGSQGNDGSFAPSLSTDGRFIAFYSDASNLVPEDTNNAPDVFVHDRETGTTERVSVGPDGSQGTGRPAPPLGFPSNGGSYFPSISGEGRYVAFWSSASDFVPDDTNERSDVFVHDRESGATERVSLGSEEGNGHSYTASISADGRFVAFESWASNLVPGDTNKAPDVYLHDRGTGATQRISVGSDGRQGNGYAFGPSVGGNGRFVAFHSLASNLVPGDTGSSDVFVHDRITGATELVSIGLGEELADGNSSTPSISADGSHIAFESGASNLVVGDGNGTGDVFVRDRGPAVGIEELFAVPENDRIAVSGRATVSGAVAGSAEDSPTDGAPGAAEAGAELTGASIIHRPEQEDLLVQLRLASLPGESVQSCARTPTFPPLAVCADESTGAGVPAVVHGLGFEIDGAGYEIRATRLGGASASTEPHFALYKCEEVCVEMTPLMGGLGTTGPAVVVSVPLGALEIQADSAIKAARAYSGLGEAATGEIAPLDELVLPDVPLDPPIVTLGIAPAGTPQAGVNFDTTAEFAAGDFSASLDASALPSGAYEVWARTCLVEICGSASAPLTKGADPSPSPTVSPSPTPSASPTPEPDVTTVSFTERSATSGQYSDETLFEARLTGSDGDPIAEADLVFEHTGAETSRSFTATTDEDGTASVTPSLEEEPGAYQLTVRYAGDDGHGGSADTASFVVAREDSDVELESRGNGANRRLLILLADADTPEDGIAGRTIELYSDGEFIGSAVTGPDGRATFDPERRHQGGPRTYEARFEGDAYYLASSAQSG